MQIEKIISRGADYADIIFSTGEKFRISKIVIYEQALRKGDQVNDELFGILTLLHKKNIVQACALNLLARRHHSKVELSRKLIQRKFDKSLIEEVLSSVESAGLINDREFAELYYDERFERGKESKRKIEHDLRKRGVDAVIIKEVSALFPDDEDNLEEIRKIASKKLSSIALAKKKPGEKKQSLFNFLISKGYDYEVIRRVMEELIVITNEE